LSALSVLWRGTGVLAEPVLRVMLRRRVRRGKELAERLPERRGIDPTPRPQGKLLWLHAASVGETVSVLPVLEALRDVPGVSVLVTTGTVTSARLLTQRCPGVLHRFVPLDVPRWVARFLDHWRPDAAAFVESELWPNLLLQAKALGVKLALLGARVSQTSADGWARAPVAARTLLGAFDLILAQDDASRERVEILGGVVDGELDLKQAAAPLPYDEAALSALSFPTRHRPILVAASTHPGEDEMIAEAFAHTASPPALLILVPRHPARADRIAAALVVQGLRYARRSTGEPIRSDTQVYLADTLGELGLFFRLAQAVVMGGSLTGGVGGHNPLEPARLGLPVITGPDVANFRETYAGLLDAHAALMVEGQSALNQAVADLMAHPDRAREIGLRAKAHAERGGQALAAAMTALRPLLPGRIH
jgi:3-deoxy-D-manno-octulosonic-acid transferase